jgi:hypothetical protein
LGQFSGPVKVRGHLVAAERKELERHETELVDVERRLADLDVQFMRRLDDLLKRGILSEEEFGRANETAREQKRELEAHKAELSHWLKQEHSKAALIGNMPRQIKSFLEAFEQLDPRQQKAQLQTLLKSVHVYRDGRIELEFRD